MSIFFLQAHVNGDEQTITAERRDRAIVVLSAEGATRVRNLNEATRIAARILGPALDKAQRTGAAWGLYVVAGDASALFGAWPPAASSPQIPGPAPKPSAPVVRIYEHWRRDGSALGALDAATKIIEIYAERSRPAAA